MARKKQVNREELLKKKRDAERRRREKMKSNPELQFTNYKEYLEKEKMRYIKRKESKKLISISELTPRRQRMQRKKWKINKQNSREKKKIIRNLLKKDTPPASEAEDYPIIGGIPAPPCSSDRRTPVNNSPNPDIPGPSQNLRRCDSMSKNKNQDVPGLCHGYCRISRMFQSTSEKLNTARRIISTLRKRDKMHQTNLLEARKQNQALLRRIRRMKQTMNQIKLEKNPLTPGTKAEVLIADVDKKEEVKKALVFKDIFQNNLNNYYETECKSKKIEMKENINPVRDQLKKYHLLQELPKLTRPSNTKERDDAIKRQIENDLKSFYEDDNNSRMTSGKKDCITHHQNKQQKRFLNDSLTNLYKKFLETHDYKVSYTHFCKARPFWVVPPTERDRETCKCKLHENVDLLAKALHGQNIILEKSSKEIVSASVCDIYNLNCIERKCPICINKGPTVMEFDNSSELTYYIWESGYKEISTKSVTKRITVTEKKQHTGKPKDVVLLLLDLVQKLYVHTANITNQYKCTTELKKQPENNSAVIHMDFSENYSSKYNTEIQSLHFGGSRKQISLHTSVIYISGSSKPTSFCTYSDCLRHDAVAVWGHIIPLLDFIEKVAPDTSTLHFITDSTCSQYRNKSMNYIIGKLHWYLPKLKTITWNYSEAGHGKGAPDGVGGTLKRTADQIVRQGKDIGDINTFAQEMKKSVKNVILEYVSEYNIIEKEFLIPTKLLKPFKGMLQVHQIVWDKNNKNIIALRRQSCILDLCKNNATACPHGKHLGFYNIPTDETNCPKTSTKTNKVVIISDVLLEPHQKFLTQNQNDCKNKSDDSVVCSPPGRSEEFFAHTNTELQQTNKTKNDEVVNIFDALLEPHLNIHGQIQDNFSENDADSVLCSPPAIALIERSKAFIAHTNTELPRELQLPSPLLLESYDTLFDIPLADEDSLPAIATCLTLLEQSLQVVNKMIAFVPECGTSAIDTRFQELYSQKLSLDVSDQLTARRSPGGGSSGELPSYVQLMPSLLARSPHNNDDCSLLMRSQNVPLGQQCHVASSLLCVHNPGNADPLGTFQSLQDEPLAHRSSTGVLVSLPSPSEIHSADRSPVKQNPIKKKKPTKSLEIDVNKTLLKPQTKKRVRPTLKTKNCDDTDSDEDAIEIKSKRLSSYCIESTDEESSGKEESKDNLHVGDWVVVNFISEKGVPYRFVGQIVKVTLFSLEVKFAKKIDDSKFKWPDKLDICSIKKNQVVKKLTPPRFKSSSRRIGTFEFPKSLKNLKINK